MNRDPKKLLLGILIGILSPIIGFVLWVEIVGTYDLEKAVELIIKGSLYSEVISLSAIMNMPVLLLFLKLNKVFIARGILLATLILSFVVLFMKLF
jgi:hypothetical protein